MSQWDQLLERAKWGQLAPREIALVARELDDERSAAPRYTLLHILGKARARSYRPLVERYLRRTDDPLLARLALQILCDFWGLTEEYLPEVATFLRGVPWDSAGYVRLMALSIAGKYLRSHAHPDLLRQLLEIFRDEHEDPLVRQGAYTALGEAMGRAWHELPSAAREMDFATEVDPGVLREAERRLLEETTGGGRMRG